MKAYIDTHVPEFLRRKWVLIVGLLVVWFVLGRIFKGVHTLDIGNSEDTPTTEVLGQFAANIRAARAENPIFVYIFNPFRQGIESFVEVIRAVISDPAPGALIPVIGWVGILAFIGFIVFATSNWRTSLLSMVLIFGCGVLGMWTYSMDTLALTIGAVVLSLVIALPIGIWAGLNDRVMKTVRPVLDLAQILPTLVYLAPLALVFLIGIAASTIATMIYSIPIGIRITAHAIRSLQNGPIEAAESMGSTRWQKLTKVQLPMAKRTIILGVNQTTLAALSFVVIAALIGAPGLGEPVLQALSIRNIGDGVTAGLAVVFIAVMLDRSTTAAVVHSNQIPLTGKPLLVRRLSLGAAAIATIVAIMISRQQLWAAVFPESLDFRDPIGNWFDAITEWFTTTFYFLTTSFNEVFTLNILNPIEYLLADAPWYLTIIMISVIAAIIGGRTVAILSAVLLLLIVWIGLWNDTMITLTQVLIATTIVMLIGVVLGVAAGRNAKFERILKPFLDAGQTLPAFVYLVPVLALFGPTRFAAIVCGVFYAAPVVVRVVADGVRGVPKEMVEAAIASGSSTTQVVTKVQLPASKKSLLLGANQGLIFVLAVVVIGGLVGAGGLGYLVLQGASKPELQGKGLAAGLAIVLLGIVMDRIAHASARRS
jgi:glycine betaine/proline transport system permease protein